MKKDEAFCETESRNLTSDPYTIKVKYHDGASKLGSDIHGAMCDLAASETVEMKKGEKKIIPLGVSMKLPDGYFGLVVPRSSTCINCGIAMGNSVGIIENDYCGENDVWGFVAIALEDTTIEAGTRIAQFMPVAMHDWATTRFEEPEEWPYPNRGGYGSTGEKAGKHVLDCNGNPIYAGSYVHMKYGNETKRVAQVFPEGEAFELESGTVNGTMSDALGAISCLERKNKRLKVENEQLKAEIERLKSETPDDCMRLPLDADGVPIRIGDTVWYVGIDDEITKCELQKVVGLVSVFGAYGTYIMTRDYPDKAIASNMLTHKQPEPPDSWEKLEEDMMRGTSSRYFGCDESRKNCRDCPHGAEQSGTSCWKNERLDILKRAKRLAGIEEQEGGKRTAIAGNEER